MARIREPAVAGLFYPSNRNQLHDDVSAYLANAIDREQDKIVPKAIIVPHAGYIYSGPIAAHR